MANPESCIPPEREGRSRGQCLSGFCNLLSSAIFPNGERPSLVPPSSYLLSESTVASYLNDSATCTLPSLSVQNKVPSGSDPIPSLKDSIARSLARPVIYGKENIAQAPTEIIHNISSSFITLIDSRLRWCTIALLKKAINPSSSSRKKKQLKTIVSLLSPLSSNTPPPIDISTIVTSFQVLPFHSISSIDILQQRVLPLVLNTIVDLHIFGTLVTVSIQAPGTISGCFSDNANFLLSNVFISFDTVSMLENMMKQARFAVKKAVRLASSLTNALIFPTRLNTSTMNMNISKAGLNLTSKRSGSKLHLKSYLDNDKNRNEELLNSIPPSVAGTCTLLPFKDPLLQQDKLCKYVAPRKTSPNMSTGLSTSEREKKIIREEPISHSLQKSDISRQPHKKTKHTA